MILLFLLLWENELFAMVNGRSSVIQTTMGACRVILLREPYDLYDSHGTSIRFYHEKENQDMVYLLTFVMEDRTGGCLGKSIEKGAYTIDGEQLTLYTLWERSGSQKEAPSGAEMRVLRMQPDCRLKEISHTIYIETHARRREDTSGMEYLFTPPKTDAEKKALEDYIHHTEKVFGGRFVRGEEARKLRSEVAKKVEEAEEKERSVWQQNP